MRIAATVPASQSLLARFTQNLDSDSLAGSTENGVKPSSSNFIVKSSPVEAVSNYFVLRGGWGIRTPTRLPTYKHT